MNSELGTTQCKKMPAFSNLFNRGTGRRYRCDRFSWPGQREILEEAFAEAVSREREVFSREVGSFFGTFSKNFVIEMTEKLLSRGRTGVIFQFNRGIPTDLSLNINCEKFLEAQNTVTISTSGTWELIKGNAPGTFVMQVNETLLPLATARRNRDAILWNGEQASLLITYSEAKSQGIL